MAITPNEAIGSKMEMEQKAIKALEQKIDDELRAKYDRRGAVSVDVSSTNCFVREEVMRRFNKAGWIIKYNSDQRDGQFLSFASQEREK